MLTTSYDEKHIICCTDSNNNSNKVLSCHKNILDMLRSHLKYSSFSYDGFFVQNKNQKATETP